MGPVSGTRISSVETPDSFSAVLSNFRWTRFSSFILRFSIRFISFWRFWNVVVIASPRRRCPARRKPSPPSYIHQVALPARFARLPRRLAVVFIRKTLASAASALASATTTASARPPKIARPARRPAFALRTRFIHFQIAPAQFLAIESGHRFGRFLVVRHFHKRKPPRTPGFPVHGHVHARHLSKRREQVAQFTFRGLKTHVADKQTLHLDSP